MLRERRGRIFVTMDVSFCEEVPFYSFASEDLLYEKSEENNLPLLDLVTPPVYPGSINEASTNL